MAARVRVFGLKNCDSCRKALRWFDERGTDYEFLDIRAEDNAGAAVAAIAGSAQWASFVNKRSTTWRGLAGKDKTDLDKAAAVGLLKKHPTLIKRPVVIIGKRILAGFDASAIDALLD